MAIVRYSREAKIKRYRNNRLLEQKVHNNCIVSVKYLTVLPVLIKPGSLEETTNGTHGEVYKVVTEGASMSCRDYSALLLN